MKKMTFVVEVDRCIGCKGCQASCKMTNNVGLGSNRMSVKTIENGKNYPETAKYFIPIMCQQCEEPACVEVCPTGACYISDGDNGILIDESLCIGCKSCNRECPYEVNTFNEELRVMDKCTMCVDEREAGETPACVKNCCGGALHVGDINDPDSEVSKLIREAGEENVYKLRDCGTKPSVTYILKREEWVDILPQECVIVRRGK